VAPLAANVRTFSAFSAGQGWSLSEIGSAKQKGGFLHDSSFLIIQLYILPKISAIILESEFSSHHRFLLEKK
jgi:hypothetical protein